MLKEEFTYAEAGVNRKLRCESKEALQVLRQTYRFSQYGDLIRLPYGNIFPVGDRYLDLVIEGIGTKVLVAQLAEKYDTIGVDGVAVAVNDVIRSGAEPLAIADNIHAQMSDPQLVGKWMKGLTEGAAEAGCLVSSGEIGDVAEIIKGLIEGKGFDFVVACVGEVFKEKIIYGNRVKPGDSVIGLRSSGIHSNGISLARKVLFKQWGGKYGPHVVPDGLEQELVYEVLEPTRIYVKQVLEAAKKSELKAAVHITGDAYLKFGKLMEFSKGIGFEFDNFDPQPIFALIQKTASEVRGVITDKEMLRTFNMGWGFAVVVDLTNVDEVIDLVEKKGVEAQRIGRVTSTGRIVAVYKGKKIQLK
jgi:phosphoribosylformylglycinamidine cyclo-ligase